MNRLCKYRGRRRMDVPHRPCCVPHECKHPKTPKVVMERLCKRCRYRAM